jgi:hypothetical protein
MGQGHIAKVIKGSDLADEILTEAFASPVEAPL